MSVKNLNKITHVAVFCGSSPGSDPLYEKQAILLGEILASRNINIIYGGTKIGLMGAVADGALQNGGTVIGVLPDFLREKEIAHPQLSKLIIVESMHERKTKMHDLSNAFIALPGGFGTLEELFEIITWAQLGLHQKPIGLLNMKGFYDPLLSQLQHMVDQGFLKKVNYDMLVTSSHIETLLDKMNQYEAPHTGKWIEKDER